MDKQILLSIIIPVYNCEKYVEECLKSIIPQLNDEIELILINDGSTDDSNIILKRYVSNNIYLYEQENKGVSAARNYGLDKAKGKYIYFCDSDDIINSNFIDFFKLNIKNDFDILSFSYRTFEGNHDETSNLMNDEKSIKLDEFVNRVKTDINTLGYLWNKIFKSSIIKENSIRFDENIKIKEDELFVLEVAYESQKIIHSNYVLYYYRNNPSSAINQNDMLKKISVLTANEKILDLLLKENYKKEAYLEWHTLINNYFRYVIRCNKQLSKEQVNDINRRYLSRKKMFRIHDLKTYIKKIYFKVKVVLKKC